MGYNGAPSAAFGLNLLLKVPGRGSLIHEVNEHLIPLDRHPFHLPTPEQEKGRAIYPRGIQYIRAGSEKILDYTRYLLYSTLGGQGGTILEKLRVITAKDMLTREHGGDTVYFEIWLRNHSVLICGSTNTYSGEGDSLHQDLRAIFAVLSIAYNIEVEEHTMKHKAGEIGRRYLISHQIEHSRSVTS